MKKIAIILAGGSGIRAGGDVPKQFQSIGSRPMLWYSMNAFKNEDNTVRIIVVLHKNYVSMWNDYMKSLPASEQINYEIVCGGHSRWNSVYNGLKAIGDVQDSEDVLVAIHDGARPVLSADLIARGWMMAAERDAAIPVCEMVDSIRYVSKSGDSKTVDRSNYVIVQTPQIFKLSVLKKSYVLPKDDMRFTDETGLSGIPPFTDDASVVEASGVEVSLYSGDLRNIKVTNPSDFDVAELYINKNR